MLGLNPEELKLLKRLSDPIKIQDFLDSLAINWEKDGETNMSPRMVLRERKAHCFEGGLLAAVALWLNGEKPLIVELKTPGEAGHIITLYKRNGRWGAMSKTNHNALRFRDPVYKTVRELVMSYFHECTNDYTGKKVMRSYSGPFNVKKWGTRWITSDEDLYYIAEQIFDASSHELFPSENEQFVRRADSFERRVGKIIEWDREDTGT